MINRRQISESVNHQPVDSKNMSYVGYDPDTQQLHVTFHDTGRYAYHNVPQDVYDGMMMSSSKGNYLHKNVKPHYEFTKV